LAIFEPLIRPTFLTFAAVAGLRIHFWFAAFFPISTLSSDFSEQVVVTGEA